MRPFPGDDDSFECDGCRRMFDIEDSIRLGALLLCETCDEEEHDNNEEWE